MAVKRPKETVLDRPVSEICTMEPVYVSEEDRFDRILGTIVERGYKRLPVVDRHGRVTGKISTLDILGFIGGDERARVFRQLKMGMGIKAKRIMSKTKTMDSKTTTGKALEAFWRDRLNFYPVERAGRLAGVLTDWDFAKIVDSPFTARDIMTPKPMIARKEYSVYDVSKILCRAGFRRLPVADEGRVLGMVTPYDILKYLKTEGIASLERRRERVVEVMNRNYISVDPKTRIPNIITAMKEKKVNSVLVTEKGRLLGIVTTRDITDAFLWQRKLQSRE